MAAHVAVARGRCCRWCGGGGALRTSTERGDKAPDLVRSPPGDCLVGLGQLPVRGSDPDGTTFAADAILYIPTAPDVLIAIFIGIWAAIALITLLRLVPSVHAVYALRDRCHPFPSNVESLLPLWLEVKEHGRRTQLMLCDDVPGATVLGFQRPCIAIPSTLIDALTLEELDQVILHEHAHVQRRDDWARLAQTLLLSVLWIHPAALLVSRALNREREMACDEWVVARTGLPKAYARCLAHAAEVRGRLRCGLPLVQAFLGRRHDLEQRVDRLLAIKNPRRNVSVAGAVIAVCAMAVISAQMQTVRVFEEIAEIMLPHVSAPMISVYNATALRETPATVRLAQIAVRLKPDTTYDAAPFVPELEIATAAPDAPMLSARIFAGAYSLPNAPSAPIAPNAPVFAHELQIASADKPNPWRAVAAPGLEIAAAAKKTSLGIASVFSRAGVSLARSF
jgi:beta-lactamase regulating signal transducer with metallopeptidase domain